MAQYQWKPGGPKPPVDAQTFGEVVEKLAGGELGSAQPGDIVDAARKRGSPIRDCFEWDDSVAAEEHRKQQARQLVGALQIVRVHVEGGPTLSNRAFFSVREADRRGYKPIEKIMGDADLRKQVLEDARGELESYLKKFSAVMALGRFVPELQSIVDAMRDEADQLLADASRRTARKAAKTTEITANP
jgi:hypothetical protein